jgi:thioredoxin:protein disulfide reductase
MLRIMKYRLLIPALLAVTAAGAKDEFLPMERAFSYLAQSDGRCVTVQWNVAPGYYLYKSRMALKSATPGVAVGELHYPKGEIHHDEYFGDQEVFRDDFVVTAPLTLTAGKPRELTLKLELQGCADAGLCYPPTVWDVKVPLPAERAPTVSPGG